eukprot:TRINITY_DN16403_c0_g1_i1.p1 TRINITY_DN16403_c0_g1~~TRINITY_DN16403_c0_g1_i1.p1  ORF type:complete len:414 (+),score=52.86 TRINITY_DN16403_c0_g1_i1:94-1335(+)
MAEVLLQRWQGAALPCQKSLCGIQSDSLRGQFRLLPPGRSPICCSGARQRRRGSDVFVGQHSILQSVGGLSEWKSSSSNRGRRKNGVFARVIGPSTGVAAAAEEEAARGALEEGEEAFEDEGEDLSDITEWQLDFCSRPIVDERGKKVWELLICDSARRFEYAQYFPNNVINSGSLRQALQDILDKFDIPKPRTIKYFRSQMQTIISRACDELNIKAVPSKRVNTLMKWLDERVETVYSKEPGYQDSATPLFMLDPPQPEPLPEDLVGERWAFVELPVAGLLEEAEAVRSRRVFGDVLSLEDNGVDLPDDALVPGLVVFTRRAPAVAARMASLELACLEVDQQRGCVILNVGVAQRWRYATYKRTKQTDQEAVAWEEAKKAAQGLHFLALQKGQDVDKVEGLWMLKDVQIPSV